MPFNVWSAAFDDSQSAGRIISPLPTEARRSGVEVRFSRATVGSRLGYIVELKANRRMAERPRDTASENEMDICSRPSQSQCNSLPRARRS